MPLPALLRSSTAARLERVEGRAAWMYRCPAGRVTCGVGHVLATAAEAYALPFRIATLNATAFDIQHDYERVYRAPAGWSARSYEHLTICRLSDDAIDELLAADIEKFTATVNAAIPWFSGAPEPARDAVLDIAFNAGVAGLLKFRRMLAAIESGNWEMAAVESRRPQVSEDRNREIARLLRSCDA